MSKGKITEYTKASLADKVAAAYGWSKKQAMDAVDGVLDGIHALMLEGSKGTDGARLTVKGFGSFESVRTAAKKGRNPRTGEEIKVPAARAVRFRPSTTMKDAIKAVK